MQEICSYIYGIEIKYTASYSQFALETFRAFSGIFKVNPRNMYIYQAFNVQNCVLRYEKLLFMPPVPWFIAKYSS